MDTQQARPPTFYPASGAARDRFVLDRRTPRPEHDLWRYQDVIVEDERTADGPIARSATVFLTGRECPWRCVMCDLWRYTTGADTPPGAIAAQVAAARTRWQREQLPVTHVKLYNAGSFFDPRAVPESDYGRVASAIAGVAQVVVESHPALIGPRVDQFLEALAARGESLVSHRDGRDAPPARRDDREYREYLSEEQRSRRGWIARRMQPDFHHGLLEVCRGADAPLKPGVQTGPPTRLEVAMGLETVHPSALERLHKRMTVEQFAVAAATLRARGVSLRVFLLIAPPFIPPDEQEAWLLKSVDVALDCGAAAVTLIPTRAGNGAMEALSAEGAFRPPTLEDIERSAEAAQARIRDRERIFVDIWDLERFSGCSACFAARRDRLHAMNLEQRILPPIACEHVHAVSDGKT